jgi:hypothetical protein
MQGALPKHFFMSTITLKCFGSFFASRNHSGVVALNTGCC